MTTRIEAGQLGERLPELPARTQRDGERFLIQQDGQPVAALVPPVDLDDALTPPVPDAGAGALEPSPTANETELEEAFLRSMVVRGLIARSVPGPVVPLDERPAIHVIGVPLSQTIIEDRR